MKYILIMVVLTFGGELEYRKYEFINTGKSNEEIIIQCSEYADKIRHEIAYHTWNYKNQGSKSQGWYMYDKSGMLIAHIC
tara:strand:- start:180 stop:419 length:240 start_codon:yes stop_codon:yes gene_type:complete